MRTSIVKRFVKGDQGTVALIAGLAAIPMFLACGVAVDYMRAHAVRTKLQNAVDAAALAAAASAGMVESRRIKMGDDVFLENWNGGVAEIAGAKAEFKVEGGGIKGTATADVPVSLMKIAGYNKVVVGAETFIEIPQLKNAEIALVLDYSGSMEKLSGGEVKYVAMRGAATDLVKDLARLAPGKVKFGLVPFSHHVWATLPSRFVAGQTTGGPWSGCTQDRPYPHNTGVVPPNVNDDGTKWGQPQAPEHISDGCGAYVPNGLRVLPLTNDTGRVESQLAAMKPYAWTHITLGVEFGYHLLTPGSPYTQAAPMGDNSVRKYMVVLTDGEQTEPGFGPGGSRTVEDAERNLETLCESAKAGGITMMTIAVGIDDADTRARLEGCATDGEKNYFEVSKGDEIAAVFDVITSQIKRQVFVSK